MEPELLRRIEAIEARNERVALDKAWEVSWARFATNVFATYVTMNLLLLSIGGTFPPVHALVPTIGYVLSTLSIPHVKKWWIAGRFDSAAARDRQGQTVSKGEISL